MSTKKRAETDPGTAGEDTAPPRAPEEQMTSFGYRRVPSREKGVLVRNQFDRVARRYDLMNTLLSVGIHYLWKRAAVRHLQLKEGQSVLDVCGGTGDLSVMAAGQLGPSGKVVLYDINWAMMEAGRHKSTHTAERKKLLYVQGDAEQAAFRSGSFDAAMVGFGLRNLTDREAGLREIHRVLKPGGRFACLEFSRPTAPWFRFLYDFYSFRVIPALGRLITGSKEAYTYLPESIRLFPLPEELSRVMETVGFRDVRYRRLTNGIACIHFGVKREH